MLFKLAVFLGLAASIFAGCPANTFYSYYDGMCYYSYNSTLLWSSAGNLCNSMGGNLVTPRNAFENNIFVGILQEFNSLGSWIGVFSNNNGVWFDQSGNTITYYKWAPGQPSVSGSCGYMTPDGYWYADSCNTGDRFICRINPNGTVVVPTTTSAPITTATVPTNPIIRCKGYNNTKSNPCNSGWKFYVNTCSCYSVPQTAGETWYDAEQYCAGRQAHLASIHSQDEAVFVKSMTDSYQKGIYVGLQNIGGNWIWSDGTPANYINWSYNDYSSDVSKNNCASMLSDGYYFATYLMNIPCTTKQYLTICKKPYA